MAVTVDHRVVEMRFDNKQFESGAKQTMGTLSKLKEALKFTDVSKSFVNIQKAADNVDMSGLGKVVDGIKVKFSALEVAAITAMSNMVNRAVDAGVHLAKSLSIDQVMAGFREYELKMGSIQTIMASTGESLETVNGYLQELNEYSDKTIYSFSDMTQNIGKFTNAGVKLEDAVKAIQGISNEAAVSGANANEASRAMYNFAQALSTGYVKLIDWKSIENANMATVEFKQSLLDTALAMGTVVKEGDKYRTVTTDLNGNVSDLFDSTSMFNDSLAHQWMSTDVLVQTLNNYSNDVRTMTDAEKAAYEEKLRGIGYTEAQIKKIEELGVKAFNSAQDVKTFSQLIDTMRESVGSGWAQTFELIFGDFEEAKQLWTNVNNTLGAIIQKSSDSRNELLRNWKNAGGRNDLIKAVSNSFNSLLDIIKVVREAYGDVFPKITGRRLEQITKRFADFTSKLKLSEEGSKNLHDAFKGLFDVISLILDVFKNLIIAILPINKPVAELGKDFLGLVGAIGRVLTSFTEIIRSSDFMKKSFDFISSGISFIVDVFSILIVSIKEFLDSISKLPVIQKIINTIGTAFNNLGGIAEKANFRFKPFEDMLEILLNIIKKTGPTVINVIKDIGNAFLFILNAISNALGTGEYSSIYDIFNFGVLITIGSQLSKFIKNINNTVNSAGGIFNNIKKIVSGITDTFDDLQTTLQARTLMEIGIALALVAGSIFAISMIDSEKLSGSLLAVSILIGELVGVFVLLNKIDANEKGSLKALGSLISMSLSILILASALKKISDIDSGSLIGSLGAITVLLIEMTGVAIVLSKYGGKIKTGIVGIIAFSASIYVLSSAVRRLGDLDVEVITKGLISVGVLLAELAAFMTALKFGNFKSSQAVSIIILSWSLLILQKAVDGFGSMNIEKLLTGILAVGAVLTEIAAFSLVAGESKHILSTSVSLIIMAKALEMLEKPMITFGAMDISRIGKGLLAMGGALAEIILAMRLLPKNSLTISLGLLVTADALNAISDIVLKMSIMSWEEIAKGMITLGGSMSILAISMNAMKGTLGAATAMLIISESLENFVPTLKTLASMSWMEIAKGFVALAGGFAVVGIAGHLLAPVIPSILGLAGAMTLLGIAAAAVGIGVLAFSAGLTALAASGVAGAAALVEIIKILIVGLLDAISDSSFELGKAIETLILVTCDVLIKSVPTVVQTVLVIIKEVLVALVDNIPEITTQILKLVIGIIDSIAIELPTLITSVLNLFMQFFSGLIQALNGIDTNFLIEAIAGIGLISAVMLALAASYKLAPLAMKGVLAIGIIIAELAIVLAAIGALAQIPGLSWLINEGGVLLEGIGVAIGKFIGGIVGGTIEGMMSQLPQIGTYLSEFMTNLGPFITGSKSLDAGAVASVGLLAAVIMALTGAEVINGIASLFGLSLVDVAMELSNFMVALTPFIMLSRGVQKESMEACAYIAEMILALTAANIVSGIGRVLGIGGNLSEFGTQLTDFGPSIAKFAEQVRGVRPEAVQGAAAAAQIMAEVARKLPGTGGLVQKIFGEKSLAEFAWELTEFGPAIDKFAEQVRNVKPEMVEGAGAAAEIMSTLANNLPNTGGLAAKIFGDNKLSDFGDELIAFAPDIVKFSKQVRSVTPESVEGAASAAGIMKELADTLPNSETLWNKIFGGGQVTLSEFGGEIASFGTSMASFSTSVSGINVGQLDGLIESLEEMIALARDASGVSATDLVNLADQVSQIGTSSVDGLLDSFSISGVASKISSAVSTIFSSMQTAVQNKRELFSSMGIFSVDSLTSGMTSKMVDVNETGIAIGESFRKALTIGSPMLLIQGGATALQYLAGIKNKYPESSSVGKALSNYALSGVQLLISGFYGAGVNAGKGFADGLNSMLGSATAAGEALGRAAYEAAKEALDEHSPSKKMKQVGDFAGLGFIQSLLAYVAKAEEAGKEIGESAVKGTISVITRIDDFNIDPTIRPSVDLENVRKSVSDINRMFNDSIAYTASLASSTSSSVAASKQGNQIQNQQEIDKDSKGGNTYNFVQNNNSPKALSRIEIYRQTKNQFSQFKEATSRV